MNAPQRIALHSMLLASADRDPGRTAFLGKGAVTTYGQLVERSRRIAAGLRERGLEKGDRVGIVLDTCVEYLATYYGVLWAGGVVVPLCPDTRTSTLRDALGRTEARAVVLDGGSARYLSGEAATIPSLRLVVTIGAPRLEDPGSLDVVEWADLSAAAAGSPDGGAGPDDLCSIVFTSGTTGRPKGVMLSHANLVANVRSIVLALGLGREDRVAMVLPPYYVYGNSVLHTHVCAGGSIADVGTMTFPGVVLDAIQRHRCTGLSGVPSTFARLLGFSSLSRYDLGSLRYITQAGATMSPALAGRIRERFPEAKLFVMYGQAEAAARLTVLPPEDLDRKAGSAGRAIPGVTLRVVDDSGAELPRGKVGEIVAQGDNVMIGYWRDPDETARVLRPEGLRTGDLGSMDGEGYLTIADRESEIIKSGAHRIGPREIEEVIERLAEVDECAVVGVPDELLGEAIFAFVVTRSGASLDALRVLRCCHEHLPRFKLPAQVRFVGSLPRTSTGKVRRLALREKI